ncbi:shikimate kinase [Paenarthrobacter sp. PH39-S1]|uniref:shikimate kinase n=1 Tax=Micrococcaceae TaxID=1268 RepID=UPI0024BA591C|nr:shikimate kinase [Paenarthrobacter sp. PH39-S1]MDJ0355518.1 shikimate kinase [Paenarthrobacter sp. PH39-S1]
MPRHTLVLIGPMAVGKSAIGQELARALALEFIDSDQAIVQKHGSIADIFAGRGENHFRRLEAKAIADALESGLRRPMVLSLGGGAVLDTGTAQLLGEAIVIHLDADLDTVRGRILRGGRPLLAGDPLERWQHLAAARGPVYRALADVTLNVREGTVEELVQQLIRLLQQHGGADGPGSGLGPGSGSAAKFAATEAADGTINAQESGTQ